MPTPTPPRNKPSISIIIPSFNGRERLQRLLPKLASIAEECIEVIIVIDGSEDGSLELITRSFPSMSPIWRANGGRAAARNSGARATSSDLIIFLDDDCIPDDQFINEHSIHHEKHPNSIATGPQISPLGMKTEFEKYRHAKSLEFSNSLLELEEISHLKFLTAANMSVPRILFEKLGGFNEELTDCEDYDLAIRAASKSIAIYYLPTAPVIHDDRLNIRSYISRMASYRHNHFLLEQSIKTRDGGLNSVRSKAKHIVFTNLIWQSIFKLQILHRILPIKTWTKLYDAFIWEQAGRLSLEKTEVQKVTHTTSVSAQKQI